MGNVNSLTLYIDGTINQYDIIEFGTLFILRGRSWVKLFLSLLVSLVRTSNGTFYTRISIAHQCFIYGFSDNVKWDIPNVT